MANQSPWDDLELRRGDYQFLESDNASVLYLRIPTILMKARLKDNALDYSHPLRGEGLTTLARHIELGYVVLAGSRYQTATESGFEFIIYRK